MAEVPVGRFAPTPSGRMHLGNVFAAMIAWLSVKSKNGEMVLRMEDLDTLRTSTAFAETLRQDLKWLGLVWDRETPPQSSRSAVYDRYFELLREKDLLYPCYCTRSQLHSVNAPHLSDGTYVYPGTCRTLSAAERASFGREGAWRIQVPDRVWGFTDLGQGAYRQNLAADCGDFIVRRADGVYVYQLAVTVDDGEAGVTEVVRGMDLLSSAPRQMYLQELLGFAQKHEDFVMEPAKITAWSSSNWSSSFSISKGADNSEHPVEVGDCVVTEYGALVGQVIEVGSSWSTVRTVIDSSIDVGALVGEAGSVGMCVGDFALMQQGLLKLTYLSENAQLVEGEAVLTSGKGTYIPQGLIIGYIRSVLSEASGQTLYGVVEPACDLGRLSQVFVITDFHIQE